jgi:hypothetical protein
MNIGTLLLATVLQFVLGALWYSPFMFGKWRMEIMEVTHVSKEDLKKMQKEMMPFYALQFVLTLVTLFVLQAQITYNNLSGSAAYVFALFIWIGYIAPIIVQTVIWGNTKKKFWVKQIFVSLSYQLLAIMIATLVLTM